MSDKRVLVAAAIVVVLFLYWVVNAFISDETKIRWQIEAAVESFNSCRGGACAAILSEKYRDDTSGATRDSVRKFLLPIFLRKQNKQGGLFLYPVRIPQEDLEINVTADAEAKVDLRIEFHKLETEGEAPVWELKIAAVFNKEDGEWLAQRTSFEILSGKQPW